MTKSAKVVSSSFSIIVIFLLQRATCKEFVQVLSGGAHPCTKERSAGAVEVLDLRHRFCGLAFMAQSFPLDRIDRKILLNLQAEGRLTNEALSERVALSPSACLARVRRLERAGVIQGYHARLDPFKIEVGLVVFAEITLKAHGSADLTRFVETAALIPEIVEASHVSGPFDYILKVVVPDITAWSRIGERLTAEGGTDRIVTHILLDKPKVFVGYPVKLV